MSEIKPTPGPWFTHREGFSTIYIQASIGGGWVQEIAACGPTNDGSAQQEANAHLIAEAGTVFHNTGLSPVQLVEQRDELIAACKKLVEWDAREKDHAISFMDRIHLCDEAFQMMRAALAKCEGVGNDR